MPGYHVHSIFTEAGLDEDKRPIPAGRTHIELPYGGSLLFMSDRSQLLMNYDVFHSSSHVAMGPLSQAYVYLGKLHEVYPPTLWLPQTPQHARTSERETLLDERTLGLRALCGHHKPIYQMWAFGDYNGSVNLYVQKVGQRPPDVFVHYVLRVADPSDWWRARHYECVGAVSMPDWAPKPLRAAL